MTSDEDSAAEYLCVYPYAQGYLEFLKAKTLLPEELSSAKEVMEAPPEDLSKPKMHLLSEV